MVSHYNNIICKLMEDDLTDYERKLLKKGKSYPAKKREIRACPHCGNPKAQQNGYVSGVCRYRCPTCGRGFGDTEGTIFFGSRTHIRDWAKLYREFQKMKKLDEPKEPKVG